MPGKDRFWRDDGQRRAPVTPEAGQADPRKARVRVGRTSRSRGREVRHVYRQHPESRRQFGSEDAVVEGQALHELEKTATASRAERSPHHQDSKNTSKSMMQRILNSKNLVAFVLAAATGMAFYFRMPFPEGNIFLRVMALRSPFAFEVLKYSHTLFLFSTPVHWLLPCVLRVVHFLRSSRNNQRPHKQTPHSSVR
jgi:hypothetical protein